MHITSVWIIYYYYYYYYYYYIVRALQNTLINVGSLILVFILIAPYQFEQVLPNLSSFDQSIVSSSLRNLIKLKKSEKHSRSFVWKLISKPGCVFCVNKNKQYIYTYRCRHLPGHFFKVFLFLTKWVNQISP